jgi:MoxR-like ATPase
LASGLSDDEGVRVSLPAMGAAERGVDDPTLAGAIERAGRLAANVEQVVHGKSQEIRLVLAALISGGHVLLEDLPGTAKTVLARSLAVSIAGASFSRIQCTPDLQPTDVTGLSIFDQRTREFEFRPGPVFAHVLLVDEVNRAMPKTQSALLEAMAEHQVTVEGATHRLEEPFLVLATQNPIEQEGTFPLPEAQLDRFAIKTTLGYPQVEAEIQIVEEQRHVHPLESLGEVVSTDELLEIRAAAERVYVDRLVLRWLVELVRATRELEEVSFGASVRASLALERVARAWALMDGRSYVDPSDVEDLFLPVVAHRLVFEPFALAVEGMSTDRSLLERVKSECLRLAPVPAPAWEGAAPSQANAR